MYKHLHPSNIYAHKTIQIYVSICCIKLRLLPIICNHTKTVSVQTKINQHYEQKKTSEAGYIKIKKRSST